MSKPPWALGLAIVAVSVVLGFGYAQVPLGEKPDEPSHLARIVYQARWGRVPQPWNTSVFMNVVTYEAVQPPAYYWLASHLIRALPPIRWNVVPEPTWECLERARRFVVEGGPEVPPQVMALRLWGLAMVVASSLLAFDAALCFGATFREALTALALVAWVPQLLFVGTSVSNDPLAVLMGAVAIWTLSRAWRAGLPGWGFVAGACCAGGVAVKLSLCPYAVGGLGVLLTGKRRILTSGAFVAGVVVCLLGALLASGSVPLPSWRPWQGVVVAVARKDYLAFLQDVIATYWARFGWMDLKPPAPVIWVWVGILSLATVGWMLRPRRDHLPWLPLGLLLAAALAGWALTLRSSHQVQGRFFLPFAPIIALILARGLQWVPRTALILLMASVVGAHAVSLAALASRYRAPDGPQDMAMDAHQCTRDRTVLELLSQGNQVGQTFFSTRPGLCAIDVVFSGSQRQGDAVLRVSDPATGQVLREARRACASLRSGRHERFTFRPLMKSGGRVLEFSLLVTAAERDANLSVWFKLGDPYLDGVRVVNGERRDGDLWFVTWVGKEG